MPKGGLEFSILLAEWRTVGRPALWRPLTDNEILVMRFSKEAKDRCAIPIARYLRALRGDSIFWAAFTLVMTYAACRAFSLPVVPSVLIAVLVWLVMVGMEGGPDVVFENGDVEIEIRCPETNNRYIKVLPSAIVSVMVEIGHQMRWYVVLNIKNSPRRVSYMLEGNEAVTRRILSSISEEVEVPSWLTDRL